MVTQCPALMESSKTGLGRSSQVLILRTFELVWFSQSDLRFWTNIPYGSTSDVVWAAWLRDLLGKPGSDHRDKGAQVVLIVPLVCSPPLGCSKAWVHWETCWGSWDLPVSFLVCGQFATGSKLNFCCTVRCLLWDVHPAALPLSSPFLKSLFCLTVIFAGPWLFL